MTIRYRRAPGTLHIERVQALTELTELAYQAEEVRETALAVKRRAHRLKLGLLEDHARRQAFTGERPARPRDAPTCTRDEALHARQRVGLSQRELAAHLGVHRSVVAEAERGRRTAPPKLAAWAKQVLAADAAAPPATTLDVAHLEALARVPGYEEVDE